MSNIGDDSSSSESQQQQESIQDSIFHPKNKVELMSSAGIEEANPEEADDNDNETAIAVSLMTGNGDNNSEADFRSSSRSISSYASKGSGSIFGRIRASSSHAELDDQLGDSYSDSSGGSYKRYSVWTK